MKPLELVLITTYMLVLLVAVLFAAQTELRCDYDDQVMTSSGVCLELDAIHDAATDQKGN